MAKTIRNGKQQSSKLNALRNRAVQQVMPIALETVNLLTPDEIAEMMYDLETHQIELGMQNEELCKAQSELIEISDQYTELYDLAPIAYFSTDKSDLITQSNLTLSDMLEVPRSKLTNRRLSEFVADCDLDNYYIHRQKVLANRSRTNCELGLLTLSNRLIWVRLDSVCVENSAGACYEIRSVLTDITEQKQADEKLKMLSSALESSASLVIIINLDGKIEYVNTKFNEITGYTKNEAIGKNPHILLSGKAPDKRYDDMWKKIRAGDEWKGEVHNRKKNGSFYWARASISGVRDLKGQITHYLNIQDDITHEYDLSSKQLNFQATHDTLTGLINRKEFVRRVEHSFSAAQQNKQEHALCVISLDQFKEIHDTCGQAAENEFLCQLGQILQATIQRQDIIGRFYGDEFAVLIKYCTIEQAHRVATTLIQAIDNFHFSWEDQTFRVGVNIGLVSVTESSADLYELLKYANFSCNIAKGLGKNRIYVFRREDSDIALCHEEKHWVSRINHVFSENRFCLYAQAIVPLDDGNCTDQHYELLLRMVDETGEILSPGVFFTAAERYGLTEKLDLWVINQAFDMLMAHPDFVKQTSLISINLSSQSFTNPEFLDLITSRLRTSGIEANKICFEITESAIITNLSTAISFMTTLKNLGCKFALDNFGSGLSSFNSLKNLPVDYLKIDGIFVKDIANQIDYAMLKSINEIGQAMGIKTITEFVETVETCEMIKALGINYAQGSGVEKSIPFQQLLDASINT